MLRVLLALPILAAPGLAAVDDGAALFAAHCAQCHNATGKVERAPAPGVLRTLSKQTILAALDTGVMKAQASMLNTGEKVAIAEYLGSPVAGAPAAAHTCASNPPIEKLEGWNGWGADLENSRFQPAARAGLGAADVPRLKLKWAFGFPQTFSVFGQPSVVGGRLFFGSSSGDVYSLDSQSGCQYWTFRASSTVRTAITAAPLPDGGYAAYFGDTQAFVYALDAQTGTLLWKTHIDDHKMARITGAPKLVAGRLYVPVASGVEEMAAAQQGYPCCTFRGSLVALDAQSGKQVWKTYTIPDAPRETGVSASGTKKFGPAGVSIWNSPTIDRKRKLIYAGTGNDYTEPRTPYSDAVFAFDMDTGAVRWVKQLTPGDAWNGGCITPSKHACPPNAGEDTDIGASPVLITVNGRDILVVGQKSGVVYGIDPAHKGNILWQTRVGHGGALGGIMWGLAAEGGRAYVPLSDYAGEALDSGGGIFALTLSDGKVAWKVPPAKPACVGKRGCSPAQMAPATLIPGVVFSGSMDGHLRAYASGDGAVIWDFDTLGDFATVNGVAAHGGSLNATGATVAGGLVFANSGYGQLGGMPGNVLLAFSPDGK
ncbi:MAG TPA: PQQ-binding-like beta-propeller repeat protein [Bryobacteraceae bacterium]|jgi:polyvinyl alcohol dehydrogenase (cytochrome)|nr:PQQ-binding-like beta-propeller repeat protein [Bryobacteraceae bacterium]